MTLRQAYTLLKIPSRFSVCIKCGSPVESRTAPRKHCESCAAERKLLSSRNAMEKQRRKRGVAKVKGTSISCGQCGTEFVRDGIRAKFCQPCGEMRSIKEARRNSEKKRNTEEGRAYLNSWQRARRKSDPAWRVSAHMRTTIHRAIGKRKQGRSWRTFVPYSLDELMRHLERQFTPGMCWEKVGREIHIDHIVPLAAFNFQNINDQECKAAWAITNLRPMWAIENIRKNAKRTHLI